MASLIWLGALYPHQNNHEATLEWLNIPYLRRMQDPGFGLKAIIAKGNIIEGVEAKS